MRLTTKQDIEAPLSHVYRVMTDFDGWERAAMRRGAEVSRTDTLRQPGVGMSWKIRAEIRGKVRKMTVKLTEEHLNSRLKFDMDSPSVTGEFFVEMMDLSPKRTRLSVVMEIKPKTLAARLFIQSLKLAKAKVQRRYDTRVSQLATTIEDRYKTKTTV